MKTLQKFSSVDDAFQNHFNPDCYFISKETDKAQRLAALAEWKTLAAQAQSGDAISLACPHSLKVSVGRQHSSLSATHFAARTI